MTEVPKKEQIGACHVQNATWSWPCPRGVLSMVDLFGNLACFHGPGACVARPSRCCFLPGADRARLLRPWRLGSCYKVLEKSKKKRARHWRQQAFLVRGTSSWSPVASLFVVISSSSYGGVGSRIALAG